MNITNMIRKDHEITWTVEANNSFKDTKQSISEAHVLVSSDFDKDFLIFSYASEHTVTTIFTKE